MGKSHMAVTERTLDKTQGLLGFICNNTFECIISSLMCCYLTSPYSAGVSFHMLSVQVKYWCPYLKLDDSVLRHIHVPGGDGVFPSLIGYKHHGRVIFPVVQNQQVRYRTPGNHSGLNSALEEIYVLNVRLHTNTCGSLQTVMLMHRFSSPYLKSKHTMY